ncbi:MlaE family ABC transporter permease [Neorickettsia sennetsu]|uniref:ABC transporter, permease protein n=1 Tax=Ehrlichia sennetsu (strain ATCC VR-367 / Miyayama) TaxID=222891 RepID=Q2GD73_EHRS3|nr:ABC transporter permease [Neorickettsia sennetsu]ABD46185.1 putative ABC transporter, permease protein [Neorickettsia sennetsu str. Miyayama]
MYNHIKNTIKIFGDFTLFSLSTFLSGRKIYFSEIIKQLFLIGYYSMPIVAFSAVFIGAMLAFHTYTGLDLFQSQTMVAQILAKSITREIGPVVVGIVVAGRVASTIAAEIGTMRVTEQVDLLRSLSINVHAYLVLPKIIAALISFPVLEIVSTLFGMLGGYLIGTYKFAFSKMLYVSDTLTFLTSKDLIAGMTKSFFFGFITASVSCFNALRATHGAKGVGIAVTNSVVASFVLILLSNYLITLAIFHEK